MTVTGMAGVSQQGNQPRRTPVTQIQRTGPSNNANCVDRRHRRGRGAVRRRSTTPRDVRGGIEAASRRRPSLAVQPQDPAGRWPVQGKRVKVSGSYTAASRRKCNGDVPSCGFHVTGRAKCRKVSHAKMQRYREATSPLCIPASVRMLALVAGWSVCTGRWCQTYQCPVLVSRPSLMMMYVPWAISTGL